MHLSRITIVSGAAIAALSMLLPYLRVPVDGSVGGFKAAAWPALLFLGIPLLLAVTGDRAEGFGRPAAAVAIVLSAVAVVFAVAKLVDALAAARDARDLVGGGSVGPGTWLLLGGCVLVLVGSVSTLSRRVATR